MTDSIGYVIIGRNEGERLVRSLASIPSERTGAVYVDSGSSDQSIANAIAAGATVVELDTDRPFTAARARNAGLDELLRSAPETRFVQFIDGDCQIAEGWPKAAANELKSDEKLAVVCGRRREMFPEASIYNALCDLEWDTLIGDSRSCGGDAMMRIQPLKQTGGYDESIIAGEEPDLCYRMRLLGWTVRRIDAEMTRHDADMHRFGQWWRRMVRSGHAYAEAAWRHGRGAERFGVRSSLSIGWWAIGWPLTIILLAWPTWGLSLLGFLVYPLMVVKIIRGQRARQRSWRHGLIYGVSCVLGKWPQWQGQLKFLIRKLSARPAEIIEYKAVSESGT